MWCRRTVRVMAEFRGRHFGFLGLLLATWVAARIGLLGFEPNPLVPVLLAPEQAPQIARRDASDFAVTAAPVSGFSCCNGWQVGVRQRQASTHHKPAASFRNNYGAPLIDSMYAAPAAAVVDSSAVRNTAIVLSQPAQPLLPGRRAKLYAYSFWRDGEQAGALNGGTQYGGSQSGFVATYALDSDEKLALLLRGAIAHDSLREREVGAGIRWRPSRHIPLSLNAERRFRNDRPDTFAAYVAGGVSEVRLPLQFRLETFGQAGVVSGKNAGPFFDFLARADRQVVQIGTARISAGAGAWGGGQDNIRRVDIGPSARADIALSEASFRLSADWRFRVAGNARPGNGPAVTLSTSF